MDMNDGAPGEGRSGAICGAAALSLLEAIILTLKDKGALSDIEIDEAFMAAIRAHQERPDAAEGGFHGLVASTLEVLRVEGNSVRVPTRPKTSH